MEKNKVWAFVLKSIAYIATALAGFIAGNGVNL